MAQPSEPHRRRNNNHISSFLQSTASNFLSLFNPPPLPPSPLPPPAISLPLFFAPPLSVVTFDSTAESTRPSAKSVRVSRLNSNGKSGGGGPAFVGQVFSMCDLSGTGLMAVSLYH
ncbi:Tic22 family protein [Trifolium repens]|nr:Tic22 family protein [Trifolium repens]